VIFYLSFPPFYEKRRIGVYRGNYGVLKFFFGPTRVFGPKTKVAVAVSKKNLRGERANDKLDNFGELRVDRKKVLWGPVVRRCSGLVC
jgi:hypothetical protein